MSNSPKGQMTSFIMPVDVYESLRQYAFDNRTSMTKVVVAALREKLDKQDAMERAYPNSNA